MCNPRIRRLWELDPEYGHAPWRSSPNHSERVLHIHLSTPDSPQNSLCRALASLAVGDGYLRVDWTSFGTLQQRHKAVIEAAAKLRPTLIFMQLQRPNVLATSTVAEARRAAGGDDVTIVSWCGDVGGTNGPFPETSDGWAYELSAHCDLML